MARNVFPYKDMGYEVAWILVVIRQIYIGNHSLTHSRGASINTSTLGLRRKESFFTHKQHIQSFSSLCVS